MDIKYKPLSDILTYSIPSGNWYIFELVNIQFYSKRQTLSVQGALLKKWIIDNTPKKNEFHVCAYWYQNKSDDTSETYRAAFLFKSEKLYYKFKHWCKDINFSERNHVYNDWRNDGAFPNRYDFDECLNQNGNVVIKQTIKNIPEDIFNDQMIQDDDDDEIFDAWCWCYDNIKNDYWIWENNAYIVSDEDAVTFKLKWIE